MPEVGTLVSTDHPYLLYDRDGYGCIRGYKHICTYVDIYKDQICADIWETTWRKGQGSKLAHCSLLPPLAYIISSQLL